MLRLSLSVSANLSLVVDLVAFACAIVAGLTSVALDSLLGVDSDRRSMALLTCLSSNKLDFRFRVLDLLEVNSGGDLAGAVATVLLFFVSSAAVVLTVSALVSWLVGD